MGSRRAMVAWLVVTVFIAGCSAERSTTSLGGSDTSVASSAADSIGADKTDADNTAADSTNPPSSAESTTTESTSTASTAAPISSTSSTDAAKPTSPSVSPGSTSTTEPATVDTFVNVVPSGPCTFTPPVPMGEVAWVQDGQLRAVADSAAPTCLLDGVPGTSPVSWSSDAARVLVNPANSATAKGVRSTGFDPANTSVSLSAPTGTATIGIDPVTHRLMRHGSDGAITDISFLTTTDEVIYHPGGKRIVAVGTDAAGAYGIWLSSNLGQGPKQILSVADPTIPVTNLSFSADGRDLFFIHGFVHRLIVSDLTLLEVGERDRQEAHLVESKLENATAWTIGPCDPSGTVLMASTILGQPTDVRTLAGSPFAQTAVTLQPVGWLSGYRLVLAARSSGCEGPSDLWVWSTVDGFHQVASNVLAPSVRLPRGSYVDVPDVIVQQAPG